MKHLILSALALIPLLATTAFAQDPVSATKEPPPWTGEAEAGAILVTGNSDSESYAAKLKTVYTHEKNIFTLAGSYIRAEANGTESARNWYGSLRYDRELAEMFSVFIAQRVESDIFAGYLQRDATDVGVKYFLIKKDDLNWIVEAGYRYQKTQPTIGTPFYDNLGRLYSEVNKQWDKTLSFKYWLEYLPNFSDANGYFINSEASMNVMLNSIFSLKIGYLLQYQNAPPADGKNTTTTTTMNLVAKF
ncbi:YdiY family protein [Bdellovibrio sp. NC01]|uniref:DUF481 domain-containing protein n=1 Tax=Bdellovibrio sp. NC01 TaxID=2220073 RepID=UPI00115AD158|nr:DUF481 domain-containing protein [Bdellovibrio sp. NC01]QDK39429.1 DUF481 domain-containing protein [Bdellovibrio sp. NC01]